MFSSWRRVAASAAVGAAIVAVVVASRTSRSRPASTETNRYATAPGQHATISLRDGSRIILGPSTQANVEHRADAVQVTIDGEGFFSVAPHARTAFTVHAGNSVTRVLGTTFTVRRYHSDAATRIAVLDGRVSVGSTRAGTRAGDVVLAARMLGIVHDTGDIQTVSNAIADNDTAWTSGHLEFHQATVADIVAELGRAYGVEIRVEGSVLPAQKVTCSIRIADQSLQGVLDALTNTIDAHAVRSGRVITLRPGVAAALKNVSPRSLTPESKHGR